MSHREGREARACLGARTSATNMTRFARLEPRSKYRQLFCYFRRITFRYIEAKNKQVFRRSCCAEAIAHHYCSSMFWLKSCQVESFFELEDSVVPCLKALSNQTSPRNPKLEIHTAVFYHSLHYSAIPDCLSMKYAYTVISSFAKHTPPLPIPSPEIVAPSVRNPEHKLLGLSFLRPRLISGYRTGKCVYKMYNPVPSIAPELLELIGKHNKRHFPVHISVK